MLPEKIQKLLKPQNGKGAKDQIVERLLREQHITPREAVILLKTIDISLTTQTLEMSSGAKIVGGSDFEETNLR